MIFILGISFFIGTYINPNEKDYILIKSIFSALFIIILHLVLWSNKAYEKFQEDGLTISYSNYQVIGLFIIVVNLILQINSNILHHIFF
ncbi:MAG: Unknown protein [uncultured Sulfurovum sp.]|uniref:Uncharacterized protein n=1 Tax=uncultured Sulfurovum sp. TaxID=269237 RepID=A0A6S6S332_9BACT|nr:MAG: Unknown protein [uncultured Sulfurovum sp.]